MRLLALALSAGLVGVTGFTPAHAEGAEIRAALRQGAAALGAGPLALPEPASPAIKAGPVGTGWLACNVEIYFTRQTLAFDGIQSYVWPLPPWDQATTKQAADTMRPTLGTITSAVRADQARFTMWGDTISYVLIQYYEEQCGSYFTGGTGWKYMGSYRGSRGAWVSMWAAVSTGGAWNSPIYASGNAFFNRLGGSPPF
ncbi:MAG: hypothetical protein HYZ75_14980 [Elusimicrobia bacterium]|nr:hypothetical protein [Elusimicrobiota bacterium]